MLPTIHPFGLTISMYTLMIVVGGLIGIVLVVIKRRWFEVGVGDLVQAAALAVIGAVPGSRLLNAVYKIIERAAVMHRVPPIWNAETWKWALAQGSCFYGALLGATLAVFLFAKVRRLSAGRLLGLMSYFLAASCSIGRLSCFFAGCCYGVTFPSGRQFPSQLAEAGYCSLILLLFLIARIERRNPQIMFPLFVFLYSLGRAVFEFFRAGTTRVGVVSMSQWVAFGLIILTAVWILRARQKRSA